MDAPVTGKTEQFSRRGFVTCDPRYVLLVGTGVARVPVMPNLRQQDRRKCPRIRVSWPAVINAGRSRYLSYCVDISTHGAKIRTNARLTTGTAVQLEIIPPAGPEIRVAAVVWRVDSDGLAFLFSRGIEHHLIRAA